MKKHILIFGYIEAAAFFAQTLRDQGHDVCIVAQEESQQAKNVAFEREPLKISRMPLLPEITNFQNYDPEPNKYFGKPKNNFKKR